MAQPASAIATAKNPEKKNPVAIVGAQAPKRAIVEDSKQPKSSELGSKVALQQKNQTEQDQAKVNVEVRVRTNAGAVSAQVGGESAMARRKLIKSPSAKELGRHRMQPIANTVSDSK